MNVSTARSSRPLLLIAGTILALVTSCADSDGPASWPPITAQTYESFLEDRAGFDQLVQMLETSEYTLVSANRDGEVTGLLSQNGETVRETLEDSDEWFELMSATNIETMVFSSLHSVFVPAVSTDLDDRAELVFYFYRDESPSVLCREKFEDVPCGFCDMFRIEDWTVRFMWFSGEHFDAIGQSSSDGSAVEDSDFVILNQQCMKDGLIEIGGEELAGSFNPPLGER